jgi:hypothetical protein
VAVAEVGVDPRGEKLGATCAPGSEKNSWSSCEMNGDSGSATECEWLPSIAPSMVVPLRGEARTITGFMADELLENAIVSGSPLGRTHFDL